MQSWYSIRAADKAAAEILVYDEIGGFGVGARSFVDDLKALGAVKNLTVRINSPGGSSFDGVAIYNALARHPAHKTVWVDGFAASAASVVAMAGDEIIMPANTIMMVHEPYGAALGTAADMRSMADALDRARRSIVGIYAAKTERATEEIEGLLAAETWMSAEEAFDLGFADRVADPVKIAAQFNPNKILAKRMPENVAELLKEASMPEIIPAPAEAEEPADEEIEAPGEEAPSDEAATDDAPPPIDEPAVEADAVVPDKIAAEARTVALAYAREVTELCKLAGLAERAADFIKAETPIEQVRRVLLDARAKIDAETRIDGSHPPRPAKMPVAVEWDRVINRKFSR